MYSNEDFMSEITSTPSHDYAWIYYGTVMIAREGVYTLCSTSDDEGFQAGGGAYQTATYAGPDTEGIVRRMVSVATKATELPPPSEWEMRIYKTSFSPFEVGSAVESVGAESVESGAATLSAIT
jgi:hypothetical protein